MEQGEIVIYKSTDTNNFQLGVRVEDETVWLTQAQMADLFQTTRNNVTLHISNIFKENELQENSVGKDSLLTASDGNARKAIELKENNGQHRTKQIQRYTPANHFRDKFLN